MYRCKYLCLPLENDYVLPISTDNVFMPNVKSCNKSSQSSVTITSVPPVCPKTSVCINVIKKPITFDDSVITSLCKCLHKSTILKNCNTVNCQ